MALILTLQSDTSDQFSTGDKTNPLSLTFDGISGGTKEVNLLLKNTGTSAVKVNTIARSWSGSASSDVDSISFRKDSDSTYTSNSLTIDEALEPNTSLNFWMKIVVPTARSITNIDELSLQVDHS